LANFVSGWTKTVAPGTPSAAPSGSESRPLAARGFSGLWGRKKEEKELPTAPEVNEQQPDEEGIADQEEMKTGALEPSPHIEESQLHPEEIAQEVKEDVTEAEDVIETTPKQTDRNSKELPDVSTEEKSEENKELGEAK
jgi:hypothetical protein